MCKNVQNVSIKFLYSLSLQNDLLAREQCDDETLLLRRWVNHWMNANACERELCDTMSEWMFIWNFFNNNCEYDNVSTLFETYPKCPIGIFNFDMTFSTNFCPVKIDLSGNTVWPQVCNVDWDFLGDFQTPCNTVLPFHHDTKRHVLAEQVHHWSRRSNWSCLRIWRKHLQILHDFPESPFWRLKHYLHLEPGLSPIKYSSVRWNCLKMIENVQKTRDFSIS